MNNLQVAKVVYAAQNALDETHGAAAAPSWEELTEQQRSDQAQNLGAHQSAVGKGVDPGSVVSNIGGRDNKLKYLLSNAIVSAFASYDKSLEGQTQTSTSEPKTVEDAMAKAERDIDRGNAQGQANQPEIQGPFKDNAAPGHELEPSKANTTVAPGDAQTDSPLPQQNPANQSDKRNVV